MTFRTALTALPLLIAATSALAEDPIRLKVLSFNIWYGGEQVSFTKTIEAIRAADADIVGLQEPDGNTMKIAEAAGYPYVDLRRHLISRVPLFDSGLGERTETGPAPAGSPEVTITVTPWPSDHRAVLSTIDVVPVDAPALIAAEPRLVREGRLF